MKRLLWLKANEHVLRVHLHETTVDEPPCFVLTVPQIAPISILHTSGTAGMTSVTSSVVQVTCSVDSIEPTLRVQRYGRCPVLS